MDAVVIDLFGTLVNAPTLDERSRAASRLAILLGCGTAAMERYLRTTWRIRHDGSLPTVVDLAAHMVRAVPRSETAIREITHELRVLGRARLTPEPSVVHALRALRSTGVRLGILSDASAEIVDAWPTSPLARMMDAAVFSCVAGAVKPDQRLYREICDVLAVSPSRTLYVGDGGGDELRGAQTAGMTAIAVHLRGPSDALAFNHTAWPGPALAAVENLPAYLSERA